MVIHMQIFLGFSSIGRVGETIGGTCVLVAVDILRVAVDILRVAVDILRVAVDIISNRI